MMTTPAHTQKKFTWLFLATPKNTIAARLYCARRPIAKKLRVTRSPVGI